jgi:hypothetical protein
MYRLVAASWTQYITVTPAGSTLRTTRPLQSAYRRPGAVRTAPQLPPTLSFVDLYRASTGSSTPIRIGSSRTNDAILREGRLIENPIAGFSVTCSAGTSPPRRPSSASVLAAYDAARRLLDGWAGLPATSASTSLIRSPPVLAQHPPRLGATSLWVRSFPRPPPLLPVTAPLDVSPLERECAGQGPGPGSEPSMPS